MLSFSFEFNQLKWINAISLRFKVQKFVDQTYTKMFHHFLFIAVGSHLTLRDHDVLSIVRMTQIPILRHKQFDIAL